MKILAWVLPWTIILLAIAAGVTSWIWMTREAQLTANHRAIIQSHETARGIVESDRDAIVARTNQEKADLRAAVENRNTRIAQDKALLIKERATQSAAAAAAAQAITDRDNALALSKAAISNNEQTILKQEVDIAIRDENIAKANRTIQSANRTINE